MNNYNFPKQNRFCRKRRTCFSLVLENPLQKLLTVGCSGGNGQNQLDQLRLFIVEVDSIDGQKHQHDMNADSLVAVQKGMIAHQAVPSWDALA